MKTLLIVILLALPAGLIAQTTVTKKEEWKTSFRKPDGIPQKPVVADKGKKEPKFSVLIGVGNGYKLGDREQGRFHYDTSLPLSIQFGYSPCKYVELQAEYLNTNFYSKRSWGKSYNRFNNYGLNLKLKAPISIKKMVFLPYFVVGTGKSKHIYDGVHNAIGSFKYSGSGKYAKIGGGAEVGVYRNVILFSEFNYWKIGLINFDAGNGIIVENRMYFSTVTGGIGLIF